MEKLTAIEHIMKRVKCSNIEEFRSNQKKFCEILSKELKAAGIDTSKVNVADLIDDLDTTAISELLDANLYAPYFASRAGTFENSVLEAIIQFGYSRKIQSALVIPKLFFASLSILFFLGALFKYRANPIYCTIYVVLALDSLRISYNCYTKNYYSLAAHKATESPVDIVSTIFKFAQQAVGAAPYEDPLRKMKEEVDWKILFENTIVKYATEQVNTKVMQYHCQ